MTDNKITKTLAEVMIETKDLIADPNHWTCGYWAWEYDGEISYCLEGALAVALGIELYDKSLERWWREQVDNDGLEMLQRSPEYAFMLNETRRHTDYMNVCINSFNDSVDTHEEIMEFMDSVILAAKEYDNDSSQKPF